MNQTEKMIIKFLKNTFIFLPLIYFAGALLDSCDVFLRDFIYGLPFLLVGIYFLIKENVGLLLLSSAYLFHVVFDLLYFFFIEDSYMIPFYEIICIFYDFFAGLYLLKKRSLSWWFYKPPCWLYSTVTEWLWVVWFVNRFSNLVPGWNCRSRKNTPRTTNTFLTLTFLENWFIINPTT